ncbi:MAG: hypothetical protein RQ952_00675 [Thermoproteota archaeon]|jgi:hypothetical protein|nr:hypothetical protein [Thermoproteota archaeon]
MALSTVPLDKVKKDIVSILKSLGIDAEEVASCIANIKKRKGYTTYIYSHEYASLESRLRAFIEDVEYKQLKSKVYVWSEYEGQYRYVQVGYFLPKTDEGLTQLVVLTVGVAQA